MNRIYKHNVKDGIPLPDQSVNCCVTSPPYWGLRDYGETEQLGLEKTPEEYIQNMVAVFREVKRVLKDDGTLWCNIGDSYASGGRDSRDPGKSKLHKAYEGDNFSNSLRPKDPEGIKPKDLVGIPWMLAFALRADGWYLRQDIIWHKPNPMPESVTDRCTKSHEYIFLLSKSQKYYYDAEAIKQPLVDASLQRLSQDIDNQKGSERVPGKTNGNMKAVGHKNLLDKGLKNHTMHENRLNGAKVNLEHADGKANKRSVWTVTTKPYSDSHFATFPEDLIVDCIKAGCPENGLVLDPFMGAGTTALVSAKLNRNFIGYELNPKYIDIAEKRLQKQLGMFNPLPLH